MNTFCKICGADIAGFENCRALYNELSFYTLAHPDKKLFIHQYIVDAYAAQHASENKKPITTAFALIGLCLFINYHYTGKQVQNAHIELAENKRDWGIFVQPEERAEITVADVVETKPGEDRDQMIKKWAGTVWDMWKPQHKVVMKLVIEYLKNNIINCNGK